MIFAREVSGPLTSLVKRIDAETAKNNDANLRSFVTFLSDDEGLEKKLKSLAEKEKITNTVLAIDNPAGPKAYKIAKEADVTVVLYTKHKVVVNRAYAKGELKDKDIDSIVADLSKILPSK